MTGYPLVEVIRFSAEGFACEDISDFQRIAGRDGESEVHQFAVYSLLCIGQVDECQGKFTAREMAEDPDCW